MTPAVSITSPSNGAIYTVPATATISANATDPEGHNVPEGTYTLTARAVDGAGASATTAAVTVTVTLVPTSTPLRYVVFTASADHATNVTSYMFELFASGANPNTATPVASANLGKPTPAGNNDITSDQQTLFSNLAAGTYVATVRAIGPGGSTRSASLTFTR